MSHSCAETIAQTALALVFSFALGGCATTAVVAADNGQPSETASVATLAGAPGKAGAGTIANCTPESTEMVGPYRHNNNQWGHDKAKGKYEQCLLTRQLDGHTERGWTWSWPGFDASVFAYPEIELGWKPWSGGQSTDPRFPMKVAELPQLTLDYEVETVAEGSYDLAPEVWLMNGPGPFAAANPQSITTEVMFWMDYAAGARPAGEVIEKPIIDGIEYELWKADSIGKDANGKGWLLLSFKSTTIRRKGTLELRTLLKHLIARRLVNPNDYLGSVEFGNEVMGGSGTTWVKRFDVRVGAP
ncbi:MAG TPA: hypothetical protein VER11_21985 [Polyangiaceae bacterium]|nr:hypothetical protein [Polyangiaceae bacterium]